MWIQLSDSYQQRFKSLCLSCIQILINTHKHSRCLFYSSCIVRLWMPKLTTQPTGIRIWPWLLSACFVLVEGLMDLRLFWLAVSIISASTFRENPQMIRAAPSVLPSLSSNKRGTDSTMLEDKTELHKAVITHDQDFLADL